MSGGDPKGRSGWLWVWVGGAFGVMLAAWAVLFTLASKHRVEDVPVITQPARRP